MVEIRELVLTFLERLSHNVLPKNWKRETLDACTQMYEPDIYVQSQVVIFHGSVNPHNDRLPVGLITQLVRLLHQSVLQSQIQIRFKPDFFFRLSSFYK